MKSPESNIPQDFVGTKIALINNENVLVFLRDDKPDIDFPGMWDLPGGGREDEETPFETAARELDEELSLQITPQEVIWEKAFPAVSNPDRTAVFMVIEITDKQIETAVMGDEGQEWKMMPIREFLEHTNVVPGMQTRLRDYLKYQ